MGALHEGHISLVQAAMQSGHFTVVSIFVNPTQFTNRQDLYHYPRTLDKDVALLLNPMVDAIYCPEELDVYPLGLNTRITIDNQGLDQRWEGQFRPGHFAGMQQVVKRLLDIVEPDSLFMGQKDFQQCALVAHMIRELSLPVRLQICPTIREEDGLAFSSRNVRIPSELRPKCNIIYQTLQYAASQLGKLTPEVTMKECLRRLQIPGFEPEYFAIVNGNTLEPITHWDQTNYIVALTACKVGDQQDRQVRLIDNWIIRR